MTTIESAIMITWFSPSMIAWAASGSWTLRRTCRAGRAERLGGLDHVLPTERIPISVKRTSGGTA